MRILLFFGLLLPCFAISCEEIGEDFNEPSPQFFLLTIAKSGTHLMLKTLYLLTGQQPAYVEPSLNDAKKFPFFHFPFDLSQENEKLLHAKKIILIRDIRDVCVSMVYHILRYGWFDVDKDSPEEFQALSFNEQLSRVIQYERKNGNLLEALPNALRWIEQGNALVVRFEDLVGEKGGGSESAQKEQAEKIANFLDLKLSAFDLNQIAQQLFGIDSGLFKYTFREGKIGSWKNAFNEEHKALFKSKFNSYLIAFGYEENDQWYTERDSKVGR